MKQVTCTNDDLDQLGEILAKILGNQAAKIKANDPMKSNPETQIHLERCSRLARAAAARIAERCEGGLL